MPGALSRASDTVSTDLRRLGDSEPATVDSIGCHGAQVGAENLDPSVENTPARSTDLGSDDPG